MNTWIHEACFDNYLFFLGYIISAQNKCYILSHGFPGFQKKHSLVPHSFYFNLNLRKVNFL